MNITTSKQAKVLAGILIAAAVAAGSVVITASAPTATASGVRW